MHKADARAQLEREKLDLQRRLAEADEVRRSSIVVTAERPTPSIGLPVVGVVILFFVCVVVVVVVVSSSSSFVVVCPQARRRAEELIAQQKKQEAAVVRIRIAQRYLHRWLIYCCCLFVVSAGEREETAR
jgi:hypothetical protein